MEFFENPMVIFYMTLINIFYINQNIIKVYNNKTIKFFYYDFINIALKASKYIENTKKHNLVFEIATLYLNICFLLILFLDS